MTTIRKHLLRILPALGLNVTPLGTGTAMISRHDKDRASSVADGLWVIRRGNSRVSARSPAHAAAVAAEDTEGGRCKAVELSPGAHLLVDPVAARERTHRMQKTAADYFGSEHIGAMLDFYEVNCVIDVGAHVGQFARRLRATGYTGRIVSFEPVTHNVEKLRKRAKKDPNWWVYQCALGDTDESTPMHVVHGSMSSLLGPSEYGSNRYKRFREISMEEVPVRRLDAMLDELTEGIENPRPYLKMDTQGYDLHVFEGAGARIKEFVGMQSEVALLQIYADMPRMQEAVAIFEAAGFEITGMFPVTREIETGRILEFDCVLFRASAVPEHSA